jgi:hypothetical protein
MSKRAADEEGEGEFVDKSTKRLKVSKTVSLEETVKLQSARDIHILLAFHQDAKELRNGKLICSC